MAEPAPAVVVGGARVFDGHGLSSPVDVLMEAGRVVAVNPSLTIPDVEVVDGRGATLLPGLIDAHVHLHEDGDLLRLARAGVTTALDMACWPREFVDALRHRRGLTDIRSAGIPASAPGSRHSALPGRPEASLLSGPDEAEAFVEARLAEGSDYIKLIADVPGPDQHTLDALVTAAHDHGLLAVAHAVSLAPYLMALRAGADVITHAPLDGPLDDATVATMVARGTVSVPTLTMMDAVSRRFFGRGAEDTTEAEGELAGPGYANARASVRRLARAGVPLLAGTDANATPGVPAAIPHGESLHRELALLVDAGLSTGAALRAATALPARHFRLRDRGAVEPGLRADLVLVDGDPLADIADIGRIRAVWCGGVPVDLH